MTTRHDSEWFRLVEAAVDGELNERELGELREAMAERDDLRELETTLLEMRELVRTEVEIAADSVALDGLWLRLEAELPSEVAAVDPLALQAYADGELTPSEAHRVASRMAESESARQRLEAISEMGVLVRTEVDAAAETADFAPLWSRLEAQVGTEIAAKGGLQKPTVPERPRPTFVERLFAAFGGYRSVAVSVLTAVVAVLVMWGVTRGGTSDESLADSRRNELEIRVVHINEVRSDPGYNVTVDNPSGTAPVIYIRPADSAPSAPGPVEVREQDNGPFRNPI